MTMQRKPSERLALPLYCTLFVQLLCNQFLFAWSLEHSMDLFMRIVLAANLPILAIAFFVFNLSRIMSRKETEREMEEQESNLRLEQSCQLILSLESMRHDFRNHLQVIRALADLGKAGEVSRYVTECGATMGCLGKNMSRVNHPVLQALFLSYHGKMQELGVSFAVDCAADLAGLACTPGKLTRIVGNVLQNAMEAAFAEKNLEPAVSVAISAAADQVLFSIWNNGPAIQPHILPRIFEPGFSKKGEHRGYGLYIVQTLLRELGSEIAAASNEKDGTEFRFAIPHKKTSKPS